MLKIIGIRNFVQKNEYFMETGFDCISLGELNRGV